jgi:hypothetical protein
MENLVKILKHIEDLYSDAEVSEKDIEKWLDKCPERMNTWQESLKRYDDYEIIQVIDEYWRYKDNKVKPRLVHIQAMLNTQKNDDYQANTEEQEKLASLAEITKKKLEEERIRKFGS